MHGGGVAGAISNCGGPTIQKESTAYVRKNGQIPTGGACQTSGGKMACKFVIHTVGPIYSQYKPATSEDLLRAAILSTLIEARTLQVTSVSIPAISSGIFGFPKDRCAQIILQACVDWSSMPDTGKLQLIRLCNFDTPTVSLFQKNFDKMFKQI